MDSASAPLIGTPYTPNVDPGLVGFDRSEGIHTINWQTFVVGIQYYLPPRGASLSAELQSGKIQQHRESLSSHCAQSAMDQCFGVFQSSRYVDGNIFFDLTPAVRMASPISVSTKSWLRTRASTTIALR